MERSPAVVVLDVDLHPGLDEKVDHLHVAFSCCHVEGGGPGLHVRGVADVS